jgi:hypothetical protein
LTEEGVGFGNSGLVQQLALGLMKHNNVEKRKLPK